MKFTKDTRVKLSAILHLCRLGYEYLSLKNAEWDDETNIFTSVFLRAARKMNPTVSESDTLRELSDLKIALENDDLGKAFYSRLTTQYGFKFIDLIRN